MQSCANLAIFACDSNDLMDRRLLGLVRRRGDSPLYALLQIVKAELCNLGQPCFVSMSSACEYFFLFASSRSCTFSLLKSRRCWRYRSCLMCTLCCCTKCFCFDSCDLTVLRAKLPHARLSDIVEKCYGQIRSATLGQTRSSDYCVSQVQYCITTVQYCISRQQLLIQLLAREARAFL